MKKLITNILIVIMGLTMTSCTMDNRYYKPERTQSGYDLFEYAHVIMSDVAMFVGEMEQLNSYVRSDTNSRVIMSQAEPWFIGKTIEQDSIDTTQWFINRSSLDGIRVKATMQDGLPLSETGALWSVECQFPYMAVKNVACTLERITPDSLMVTFTDGWTRNGEYPFEFEEMIFVFEYYSEPLLSLNRDLFQYTISGEATCTSIGDRNATLTFEVSDIWGTTSQRQNNNQNNNQNRFYYPIYFNNGTISANISKDGSEHNVEAVYTVSGVKIEYRDLAEFYSGNHLIEYYNDNNYYY